MEVMETHKAMIGAIIEDTSDYETYVKQDAYPGIVPNANKSANIIRRRNTDSSQ